MPPTSPMSSLFRISASMLRPWAVPTCSEGTPEAAVKSSSKIPHTYARRRRLCQLQLTSTAPRCAMLFAAVTSAPHPISSMTMTCQGNADAGAVSVNST